MRDDIDILKNLAERLQPLFNNVRYCLDGDPMPELGNILEETLGRDSEAFIRIMAKFQACDEILNSLVERLNDARDDIENTANRMHEAGK